MTTNTIINFRLFLYQAVQPLTCTLASYSKFLIGIQCRQLWDGRNKFSSRDILQTIKHMFGEDFDFGDPRRGTKKNVRPIPLFDKNDSPYLQAPEPVKKLFSKTENGKLKIEEIKPDFELRPSPANACSYFFKARDKFYICSDCCKRQYGNVMVFCHECFDQKQHEGHKYEVITNQEQGDAYCDCGRQGRISSDKFCSKHQSQEVIKVEIKQEEKDNFFDYFYSLFEIAIYSDSERYYEEILDKIFRALNKLNENSVYYNRMTFELLSEEIELKQSRRRIDPDQEYCILDVLDLTQEGAKLVAYLTGDMYCKYELAKKFCDENRGRGFSRKLMQSVVDDPLVIKKLIEEGLFYTERPEIYLDLAKENKEEGPGILMKYINYLLDNGEEGIDVVYHIFEKATVEENYGNQFNQFVLKIILDSYQVQAHTWKEKKKRKKKRDNQQEQQQQTGDRKVRFPEHIQRRFSYLGFLLILSLSEGSRAFIVNFRQYLETNKIAADKIESMLQNACEDPRHMIQRSRREEKPILAFALLLVKSPKKSQFIEEFWTKLQNDYGGDLMEIIDITYHFITIICNMDLILFRMKCKAGKASSTSPEEEAFLESSFKSFLYESKNVRAETIWQKKSNFQLQFKNAGKILKQLCAYDEEQRRFLFTSQQKFPNTMQKFAIRQNLGDFDPILENTFNYKSQFIVEDELKQQLLIDIFGTVTIEGILKNLWANELIEAEESEYRQESRKQMKMGFFYLFLLVVLDKITKGANQSIHKGIEHLRGNSQMRFKFEYFSSEEKIKELLALDDEKYMQNSESKIEEEKKLKEEEEARKQELKKKSEAKKKLMQEKFKAKQINTLQRIKSKPESAILEDDDICLLCHEKEKKDNRMVYLAEVNQDRTLCSSVHGEQNKANVLVTTCFHTIHINCFIKMEKRKQKQVFQCPLCNKLSNCVLPIQYSKQDGRLNRICSNIMIASMIFLFDIYDIQSNFILIFKHLLESKGLNSLLSFTRYEQEKSFWRRNDDFLIQLITQIYEESNKQERVMYDKSIEKLLEQIGTCKKRSYIVLQVLLVKALRARISGGDDVDLQLLKELREKIKDDEYRIIKQKIEDLSGDKIDLPEKPAEGQMGETQKESLSFNIIRPPTDSRGLTQLSKSPCQGCSMHNSLIMCLICGEFRCRACMKGMKKHSNMLFLILEKGQIRMESEKMKTNNMFRKNSNQLYFNELMLPLELKEAVKNVDKDVFLLNEDILNKVVTEFLEQ